MVPFALEIEHGVDDMLEGFGTSEAAILGDVAHEEGRKVVALGHEEKLSGGLAHLADAAGRRLKLEREHRLHRVDNEQSRLHACDLFKDALDARFGQQV